MRILTGLLALLVVLAGLLFGALNPTPARVDLYFIAFELALGAALLLSALAGALLGGLAVGMGVALPLSRRLRRQRAATAAAKNAPVDSLPAPVDPA